MALLSTPWGEVRVEDAVDLDLECEMCGTCCQAFYLSVTPPEIEVWYQRFLAGEGEHPPDVGAVRNLFVPFEGFTPPEGQIYTCRAYDKEAKRCTLMPDHPDVRPIACYAFPYVYEVQSLWQFPYPDCGIYKKAVKRLNTRLLERVWERLGVLGE